MPAVQPGDVRAHAAGRRARAGRGAGTRSCADLDRDRRARASRTGSTRASSPTSRPTRSGPSILGDLVAAGLGVQGMLWATGPGVHRARDARHGLAGRAARPARALPLRRHRRRRHPGLGVRRRRCARSWPPRERAGTDGARRWSPTARPRRTRRSRRPARRRHAPTPARDRRRRRLAMRPDALAPAIAADRAAGLRPFFVLRHVGTTSTLAIDPVARDRRDLPRRRRSGCTSTPRWPASAAVCPESAGSTTASSWRRQLLPRTRTSGCSPTSTATLFWVADRGRADSTRCRSCRSTCATPRPSRGAVIDYRDWQVPLGRRFRALKLWFVLRCYGAEGLRATRPRGTSQLAQELAARVEADPRFELAAPAPLVAGVPAAPRRRRRDARRCWRPSTPTAGCS